MTATTNTDMVLTLSYIFAGLWWGVHRFRIWTD